MASAMDCAARRRGAIAVPATVLWNASGMRALSAYRSVRARSVEMTAVVGIAASVSRVTSALKMVAVDFPAPPCAACTPVGVTVVVVIVEPAREPPIAKTASA